MTDPATARLDRVREQLRLYEHPLLAFDARTKGEGVELLIDAKIPAHTQEQATTQAGACAQAANPVAQVSPHAYVLELHPRDLDHPQFEWQFQRQLYDALHDYLIEMFVRTPQDRTLRSNDAPRERDL